MNHPAPETWMAYLYAELPASARADCDAHLRACPACQASVESWRATMGALDADHATLALPPRRSSAARWQPALRWALAASVVLGAGFLAGRAIGPNRAELKREVAAAREQLAAELAQRRDSDLQALAAATVTTTAAENRQFLADFARQLNQARGEERRALLAALQSFEERRALDYSELRDGLKLLALRTGTGFRQTESQLNLLANYLPAETDSLDPANQKRTAQPVIHDRNP